MEKEARKRNRRVTASIAVLLCTCMWADAAVLYFEDIQLALTPVAFTFYTYSSGSGNLNLSQLSCTGPTLRLWNEGYGDYTISSGKISISSALVQDTSSGGWASGEFQGGRTLTLTGKLKYKGTQFYDGPIIVANMAINSDQTWLFHELGSPSTIEGTVYFDPDATQGLGYGIAHGSDILKIEQFKLDFSFKGLTSNPVNFSTGNIGCGVGSASVIQITAMTPEPTTMVLFTIAALAFRMRIKN